MKVLGKRVLVEQKMTEKKSDIIIPEQAKDSERFDFEFTILQLGPECPTGKHEAQVGDTPVFSQHVMFMGTKLIEKDSKGMIIHVVVHYDDIIAIDNDQGKDSEEKDSIIIENPS